MKKILFTAALFLATTQACFALLSPLNQSLEEIQALIKSPELNQYLSQAEAIVEIQRIENGYIIITHSTTLIVDIEYQKNERPGPRLFKLHFHSPEKIPENSHHPVP